MPTNSELLAGAILHHQNGRLQAAELLYLEILQAEPNHVDALHLLGVIAHQIGDFDVSIRYFNQAIQQNENFADAHRNLGISYFDSGRILEAVVSFQTALGLNPNDAETEVNLGVSFKKLGELDNAIACYRRALQLNPNCAEAYNNLGVELKDQGDPIEAVAFYRRGLELKPDSADIYGNLGNVLKDLGQLDEAVQFARRAIDLQPESADAQNNLGNVLKDRSELAEALKCYRRAIEINPNCHTAYSNLIYTSLFDDESDLEELENERRSWNKVHAEPLVKSIQPHLNDRSPDRRLRIGYVSPDFRDHCQALFTVPLFKSHNHKSIEVFCYSDVARPDWVTDRLRSEVDVWKCIVGQGDAQVAECIRQDRIDILVDLTMHMANNRLLVFARKPAPVQVCWLAYPGTTGLTTMDYRLTDPHLDPPDRLGRCYSEESIPLPDTFWCYDPLDTETVVSPLPVIKNGFITFGCLNNFCKVNTRVLNLWVRVLNAVEKSRMTLLTGEGTHRRRVQDIFATAGIDPDRLKFVGHRTRNDYLKYYYEIDIGLDTVPYNGHTTSLDSFWMGVPVVSLVGNSVVGRAGLSQLTNLGFPELIAQNEEEYLEIAGDLASDLSRLKMYRASFRQRMKESTLMDGRRFARNVELAYRDMWKNWCREQGN